MTPERRYAQRWGMRRLPQWLCYALFSLLLGVAGSGTQAASSGWTGVVTFVVDGDTLYVRPIEGGAPLNVRIAGVDAPETCQPGGAEAHQALLERVLRRQVVVTTQGQDSYGRALATLTLSRDDVGLWLVRHGHAWSYQYGGSASPYVLAEQSARVLGRGLFADPQAEHPSDFRRRYGRCPPGQKSR
jgi:micrococcal nuclease